MIRYSKLHDRPFSIEYKHKGEWRRASLCSDRSQRIESNPSCNKVVFTCELQEIPAIDLFDIP